MREEKVASAVSSGIIFDSTALNDNFNTLIRGSSTERYISAKRGIQWLQCHCTDARLISGYDVYSFRCIRCVTILADSYLIVAFLSYSGNRECSIILCRSGMCITWVIKVFSNYSNTGIIGSSSEHYPADNRSIHSNKIDIVNKNFSLCYLNVIDD